MADIPLPWRAYARLQQQALKCRRADAWGWAIEAGLDCVVAAVPGAEPTAELVIRNVATVRRREVHQASARRRWAAGQSNPAHPEAAMHARLALDSIRRSLPADDWALLCRVGSGWAYDEITTADGTNPAALRVRVLRLRRALSVRSAA